MSAFGELEREIMKNKVSINDLDWQESSHGEFVVRRKSLSNSAGGKRLGASLYELAPGKKAFPFHCHHNNEEAVLVLRGNGTLRLPNKTIAITENDYIALPCGHEHAHQIINTSEAMLSYLCISTMQSPDVVEYPDSDKIGVMTGSAPGGAKTAESYKAFFRKGAAVPYFEGE